MSESEVEVVHNYSCQIQLAFTADDHTDATQMCTELSSILMDSGYGHIATAILDRNGDVVAEFCLKKE